jgi:hypothetical protein
MSRTLVAESRFFEKTSKTLQIMTPEAQSSLTKGAVLIGGIGGSCTT